MIVGVGVDLISIKRVDKACRRNPERFLKRLFSSAELALLAPRPAPVRSAAARFAAKEAVLKAIGCGIGPAALREVGIPAPPGRKPPGRPSGHAARQAGGPGLTRVGVTPTP